MEYDPLEVRLAAGLSDFSGEVVDVRRLVLNASWSHIRRFTGVGIGEVHFTVDLSWGRTDTDRVPRIVFTVAVKGKNVARNPLEVLAWMEQACVVIAQFRALEASFEASTEKECC